jgi:gliding motility-associated-like protein
MRNHHFLILLLFVFHSFIEKSSAQNCIEVETMLVDACDGFGSQEGLNEMFRFRTSSFPVNISEIEVFDGWPSQGVNTLPFNGFVQNAATAAKTTELNNTIISCGFLVEPPNGDIPPNSRVLAVTSYQVEVSLNSFANLTDTLFIIYHQHNGQAGGHFLNYNLGNPQTQELRIRLNGPNPCEEIVSYQRSQLVDINGFNNAQNGATVTFTPAGVPSYSNTGCQAPIEPFSANWTNPGPLCSDNGVIDLNDYVTGTQGGTWSGIGVTGNLFDPAQAGNGSSVTYSVLPPNDCIEQGASLTLNISVSPSVDASFSNPTSICGDSAPIDLSSWLTGTVGGVWSGNGVSGGILDVSGISGNITISYSVGSGLCANSQSSTINIIQLPPLLITGQNIYCNGEFPEALQSDPDPGASVSWYTDEALTELAGTGAEFTPELNVTTTYYVVQELDGCTSEPVSIDLEFSIVEVPQGDTLLTYCEGEPIPLATASSAGEITWYENPQLTNPVGTGSSYQTDQNNISLYAIAQVGSCVSEALKISIVELPNLTAQILTPDGTSLCDNPEISLVSEALTINEWSTGESSQSILVTEAGVYELTREGACNTATDQVTITGLPVTAQFVTDVDSGYVTLPVYVNDFSINGETCLWFLNDSSISFVAPGLLSFPDSGTYVLDLICTNSTGCIDTASTLIKVLSDQLLLTVPNVFTPNGDSFNEFFQVEHNAVKTFAARIFDRWGKPVYEWENVTTGWDGTYNGNEAPEGTYFYIINGTDVKDQGFEEKGTVILIRNN